MTTQLQAERQSDGIALTHIGGARDGQAFGLIVYGTSGKSSKRSYWRFHRAGETPYRRERRAWRTREAAQFFALALAADEA